MDFAVTHAFNRDWLGHLREVADNPSVVINAYAKKKRDHRPGTEVTSTEDLCRAANLRFPPGHRRTQWWLG